MSDSARKNNNCIFSENDLKISDYGIDNNNDKVMMNEVKTSVIQPQIKSSFINNEKEIEIKVPTTSDTMASSHNLYYNNEYKTMEINLQNKILKKKAKIRKLKEQIETLTAENEQLKNNNNQNEQIEALKNQIIKYEKSLNDTSSHYESQIESLQNKLNDNIGYINLINKFIKNISNDLNSSAYSIFNFELNLNFQDEQKETNPYMIHSIPLEQFQSILNQIENFLYEVLKENSNLKLKYNKILEVNNKLISQSNSPKNTNELHQMNSFHSTTNNIAENVFDNNYENIKKENDNNNKITIPAEQIEIFKTLEQRVNMLEQELNLQKQRNNSVYNTVNVKNDTIVKRVRSKSGNKISNLNIENPNIIDKPKKIKKKKKTIINNNGKVSQCSNISHTNNNHSKNKVNNVNRCITPMNARKRIPSGNSNLNTNNNYKGNGCFIKKVQY